MAFLTFAWPLGEQKKVYQMVVLNLHGIRDLREVWDKFIPYIRRRHSVTFRQTTSPFGEPWPALSPEYAKQKRMRFGERPILVAIGRLKRAASQKGAPGQFFEMRPRDMTFGVTLGTIYPLYHQTTAATRKDGTKIRRSWLGLKMPEDALALKGYVVRYLRALAKKSSAIGRGSA